MKFEFSQQDLDVLFPSHLRIDANLVITGHGPSLLGMVMPSLSGKRLCEVFQDDWAADALLLRAAVADRRTIGLTYRGGGQAFRGVAIALADGALLALNPVPLSTSLENFRLSDFQPGSPMVSALMLLGSGPINLLAGLALG